MCETTHLEASVAKYTVKSCRDQRSSGSIRPGELETPAAWCNLWVGARDMFKALPTGFGTVSLLYLLSSTICVQPKVRRLWCLSTLLLLWWWSFLENAMIIHRRCNSVDHGLRVCVWPPWVVTWQAHIWFLICACTMRDRRSHTLAQLLCSHMQRSS